MDRSDDSGGLPVFVYGTLRPGRANWPVAAPFCRRHEPARLPGFALYDLTYPAIVADDGAVGPPGPDRPAVRGDLLWLHPHLVAEALDRLDAFEGVDHADPDRSYYRRARHRAVGGAGRAVEAWVYVPGAELAAQVQPARRVPGDDWRP